MVAMVSIATGFLLGVLLLSMAPALPPQPAWLLLSAAGLFFGHPAVRAIAAFGMGVAWLGLVAGSRLDNAFPGTLAGRDLHVEGVVRGLPRERGDTIRFELKVTFVHGHPWRGRALVSFRAGENEPRFVPGETITATVRLSPPAGTLNPGLFDYEGWLLMKAVDARGYVKFVHARNRDAWGIVGTRSALRATLVSDLAKRPYDDTVKDLLAALAVGDSDAIGQGAWRRLTLTGTNHLLIISGLHVSLVAGFVVVLARLAGFSPRQTAIMAAALVGLYGVVAGLGLPVQRAMVMAACVFMVLFSRRAIRPETGFSLALVSVLVLEPLAPLSAGFLLSFVAVGSLLLYFRGRKGLVWWQTALASQVVVTLVMTPLLLLRLNEASLSSLPANLVAIPWVSFTVVPPLLGYLGLRTVFPDLAITLLDVAAMSLSACWRFLGMLSEANLSAVLADDFLIPGLLALLGALAMLLPRAIWPGGLAMLAFLPLITALVQGKEAPAGWRVTFLDVGQGLAVVVEGRDHVVLYDAGIGGRGFDAGERIVLPFLRSRGIRALAHLVVSHLDADHAGGVAAVRRGMPVGRMHFGTGCRDGATWRAAGLRFSLLSAQDELRGDNNSSCLLLVTDGQHTLLLTGDIEAAAEARLLDRLPRGVDVISAPHHGSRSSSSPAFLNGLMPGAVVISSGLRNRFGHPHAEVVARYRHRHARVYRNDREGAVTFRFPERTVSTARADNRRFWH